MPVFLTSVGIAFAVGALMIAIWDHQREEEHRRTLYINPESWDYREPRTPDEYIKNNRRRNEESNRVVDVAIQRLFVFSLLFFLFVVGIAGWLS